MPTAIFATQNEVLEWGFVSGQMHGDPYGEEYPLGEVTPDANSKWTLPLQPEMKDWVLMLTRIL